MKPTESKPFESIRSEGQTMVAVGETQETPNRQDTVNSFRSYDADQLQLQLDWIAPGRARVLVNGEPLLSDAGLPLTLFTRRQAPRREKTRISAA